MGNPKRIDRYSNGMVTADFAVFNVNHGKAEVRRRGLSSKNCLGELGYLKYSDEVLFMVELEEYPEIKRRVRHV